MGRTLIVYYSCTPGNTKVVAEQIQKATGYDILRLETVKPYTGSYNDIVAQGQDEINKGYKPQLKPISVTLSDYDTFLIGSPTWWYTMAPAMHTFLSENRFQDKTVVLFQTHAGWPGHVLKDMKADCKGAKFTGEKMIRFDTAVSDRMVTTEAELKEWISKL